jgi:hypothetical protein
MRYLIVLCASVALAAGSAEASDESNFCSDLGAAGLAKLWNSESLFYRDHEGKIVQLAGNAAIPKDGVDTLYYYVNSEPSQLRTRSVLNLKFVYKVDRDVDRKQVVDLRNDRWDRFREKRQARIKNDCAHVTVEGYEQFHLNSTRDYCLSTHFHQRAPEFDTLATVQRRESFAFKDMVGPAPPDLISALFGLFTPGPAAASSVQFSTAHLSQVRSWIQNFVHGETSDTCIKVKPQFPRDADHVQIRITNLGTTPNSYISQRDWYLSFLK